MSDTDTAFPDGTEAAQTGGGRGDGNGGHSTQSSLAALTLGAVGVVYGDIGTSPLYAMREALRPVARDGLEQVEILGVISLLIWTLFLIVSVKYVLFLLRADNRGEGGILALYTRVRLAIGRRSYPVLALGIAGAALFFGDAVITPAVSILSAVEGIKLVAPQFSDYVLPVTIGIIIALFLVQRRGTQSIAVFFGPITAIWFLAMGAMGVWQLVGDPHVLVAFNPVYAYIFLANHGMVAFIVMGAVFLAVTGAEALYADLGHFGARPIRLAWFGLIFPALVLNYLGQGALVISRPEALENPFFFMVPPMMLPALVALATVATVIASQAVITGAFSMTRAAIQLGFLPRLSITHTSERQSGQIYIAATNWILMVGVIAFVLNFRTSESLAAAYGISVTGTMLVESTLAIIFAWRVWRFPIWGVLLAALPFVALEFTFFLSNMTKFLHGGFVPVALAAIVATVMFAWWRGTQRAMESAQKQQVELESFARSMLKSSVHRVPGTAFFLTSNAQAVPPAMLHNLKHNRVLHEQNVILTIETMRVPQLADDERVEFDPINERFLRLTLRFGYMETPNVSRALARARRKGLKFDVMTTSFFLGRRKVVMESDTGLERSLDKIFIALGRFGADPSDFYQLPRDRVVELGARISI